MSPVVQLKKAPAKAAEGSVADVVRSRPSDPPQRSASWYPAESDIFELTVPPGEIPRPGEPDSLEEAILQLIEQVPGPRSPELPPSAERHRRPSTPPEDLP